MAAGKPVVCLALGGPAEQVTERTGIKVMANNPEQAVSDIGKAMSLLGTNSDMRHAMGEAGRKRVEDVYIWEKKGDRLDALYSSVLENVTAAAPPSLA
jgi:glycosyltransferase involved in cell wall biosynthesis